MDEGFYPGSTRAGQLLAAIGQGDLDAGAQAIAIFASLPEPHTQDERDAYGAYRRAADAAMEMLEEPKT